MNDETKGGGQPMATATSPSGRSPFARSERTAESRERGDALGEVGRRRSGSPGAGGSSKLGYALIITGLVAIGLVCWFGLKVSSKRAVGSAMQSGTVETRGVVSAPRLSSVERRAMADALDALKSLQSVTTAGLTYREYSPRVLDAKVRVDRYLQGEGRNRAFQVQIEQAMDLYVLASAAWSSKITKEYSLGDDARVELCPVANRLREEQSRIVDLLPRETARGLAVAHSVSVLWDCAYERIAEMDSVLKSN